MPGLSFKVEVDTTEAIEKLDYIKESLTEIEEQINRIANKYEYIKGLKQELDKEKIFNK